MFNGNSQGRGKEARKGPVDAAFGDIAILHGETEVGVVRQDGFVCDRRIIESQRTVKISVARNAVGMCTVHPKQWHKQNRGFADRDCFHRAIAYAPPIAQSNPTIVVGRRGLSSNSNLLARH
jgi:hypothetical protein